MVGREVGEGEGGPCRDPDWVAGNGWRTGGGGGGC